MCYVYSMCEPNVMTKKIKGIQTITRISVYTALESDKAVCSMAKEKSEG